MQTTQTTQASKPARDVAMMWAWRFTGNGDDKVSCGPCYGRDGHDAAGEARRLFGVGVYQIRADRENGRIILKRA